MTDQPYPDVKSAWEFLWEVVPRKQIRVFHYSESFEYGGYFRVFERSDFAQFRDCLLANNTHYRKHNFYFCKESWATPENIFANADSRQFNIAASIKIRSRAKVGCNSSEYILECLTNPAINNPSIPVPSIIWPTAVGACALWRLDAPISCRKCAAISRALEVGLRSRNYYMGSRGLNIFGSVQWPATTKQKGSNREYNHSPFQASKFVIGTDRHCSTDFDDLVEKYGRPRGRPDRSPK